MSTTHELTHNFWKALNASPFVFLARDAEPRAAVPMTAMLDEDANSAIWFFTRKDHPLAPGGPATATFSGKDNQMFARIEGTLTPETSRARLDQLWNTIIAAWFDGKDDPQLLLLRMDLAHGEIWNSDLGLIDNVKMLLGFDVSAKAAREHTATAL